MFCSTVDLAITEELLPNTVTLLSPALPVANIMTLHRASSTYSKTYINGAFLYLACSKDRCDHKGDSLDGSDGGGVEPQLYPHVHLLVSGL